MERRLSALHNKLYAELLQTLEYANLEFFGPTLREGTLTRRNINGKAYWYFKRMTNGVTDYIYVGPDTPALAEHMSTAKSTKTVLKQQTRALLGAGGFAYRGIASKVLGAMNDAGLFAAGTVLVGTNAFLAYQDMLGLRWGTPHETLSTGDIDFAHVTKLSVGIALNVVEPVRDSLLRLEAKPFHRSLTQTGSPWIYRIQDEAGAFDIEFLTPLVGREPKESKSVNIPWIGVGAQPLRFMDYLIEAPVRVALLVERGAILANVPDPGRFALHKIIVAERRPASLITKKRKDRLQAGAIIEELARNAPEVLRSAWEDLVQKHPKWGALVKAGSQSLSPSAYDAIQLCMSGVRTRENR